MGIHYGQLLQRWLDARGMTGADLARQMGVSLSYIPRYIRTSRRSQRRTIEKFAEAFGVSVDEYLAGPEQKHPKLAVGDNTIEAANSDTMPAPATFTRGDRCREIMDKCELLTPENIEAVRVLVDRLFAMERENYRLRARINI